MFKSLNTGELLLIRRQKIRQGNSFEVHKIVVAGDQPIKFGFEKAVQFVCVVGLLGTSSSKPNADYS